MGLFRNGMPYVNFHELNLDYILNEIKKNTKTVEEYTQAIKDLQAYVDDYFKNLDIQAEVDDKIERLIAEGRFTATLGVDYNVDTEELTFSVDFTD